MNMKKPKARTVWEKRMEIQEKDVQRINKQYAKRIDQYLLEYRYELKREIEVFYARYSTDHKITMAEARKYLNNDELEEFKNVTLEKYKQLVLDKDIPTSKIDALAYRHRISRKRALITEINRLTDELYENRNGIKKTVELNLADVFLNSSINIAESFAIDGIVEKPILSTEIVKHKLNNVWCEKKFFTRLEKHQRQFKLELDKVLTEGFIKGTPMPEMIENLMKMTDLPAKRAETLVRTEATFFNNLANIDQIRELGGKKYRILAVIDSRTSKVCRYQNNKEYFAYSFEPRDNAPPFHPKCRSTIVPVIEERMELEHKKGNKSVKQLLKEWQKEADSIMKDLKNE